MASVGKPIMEVSFSDCCSGGRAIVGGCCSAVWFVIIILFLPASWEQLGQKQYGLVRNTVTGEVDLVNTYEPGRYWLGFWKSFIEFPSTLQTIEFSDEVPEEGVQNLRVLEARDKEGRRVYLDISCQYQLEPSNLGLLYREMSTNYEDVYISALRDGLAKVMNEVSIGQAWEDYSMVNGLMEEACRTILASRHATCWGLQMWRVRLTPEYEGALIREQVRKQAQRTERARLLQSTVRAETQVILAEYRKNVTIVNATGEALRYQIERDAQARAEQALIKAQADVMAVIKDTVKLGAADGDLKDLQMTDPQLIRYQKNMMMYKQTQARMIYASPGSGVDLRQAQAGDALASGPGRRLDDGAGGRRLSEAPVGALHEL